MSQKSIVCDGDGDKEGDGDVHCTVRSRWRGRLREGGSGDWELDRYGSVVGHRKKMDIGVD